jgi:hypothetical protein
LAYFWLSFLSGTGSWPVQDELLKYTFGASPPPFKVMYF